jgi:hypothetical protein
MPGGWASLHAKSMAGERDSYLAISSLFVVAYSATNRRYPQMYPQKAPIRACSPKSPIAGVRIAAAVAFLFRVGPGKQMLSLAA